MILLIGTSRYNIREYIPKLQIHQHSLFTRKVFSRHNLSAQVFFSQSSRSSLILRHLYLQVFYVFKSSSSTSHLHIQVIFTWIWIITRSRSSSLDLDHHSIWIIITRSRSSLLDHHHGCYLMILLIIGISIEPALFHVSCRPILHVGLHQWI